MTDTVPPWLATMRTINGVEEGPGAADNPKILAMREEIARRFPNMTVYCKGYVHDSIPWCGLAVAYCMAANGIRPVFGASDTQRFLQQTLNLQGFDLDQDGEVGPLTLAAANACEDIARAVNDHSAIYEQFYRGLSNFSVFGRGWLNRLNDVTAQALAWSDDEPTKPVPVERSTPGGDPDSSLVPDPGDLGRLLAAAVPVLLPFLIRYGPVLLKAAAEIAPSLKPDQSKPWWRFTKEK